MVLLPLLMFQPPAPGAEAPPTCADGEVLSAGHCCAEGKAWSEDLGRCELRPGIGGSIDPEKTQGRGGRGARGAGRGGGGSAEGLGGLGTKPAQETAPVFGAGAGSPPAPTGLAYRTNVVVEGALDQEAVEGVLRSGMNQVRYC